MSYKERLQANNEEVGNNNLDLQRLIDQANSLPDAGEAADPVIQALNVSENGTYEAPDGVDGYSPVVVNVPSKEPVLQEKTATANGEVTPDSGYDGLSKVVVEVPDVPAVVEPLEVTENGTYEAPDGVDGFSSVVVNVASPSTQTVYIGTTAPTDDVGADGDIYIVRSETA